MSKRNRCVPDGLLISPRLLRTIDPTAPLPMQLPAHRPTTGYAQSVALMARLET